MAPEQLFSFLQRALLPLLTKAFILLLIFLYGIFAAVIVRQVQLMNTIVKHVAFSPVLFSIAFAHFLLAAALFILTIVLL